jgi:hypothetical protein
MYSISKLLHIYFFLIFPELSRVKSSSFFLDILSQRRLMVIVSQYKHVYVYDVESLVKMRDCTLEANMAIVSIGI